MLDESWPPAPATQVTVADLDALIVHYSNLLEQDKVHAEAALTQVNKSIASVEAQLVLYLKALNRKEYKHPRRTVKVAQKWRVNGPQTDADKALLFDWMRTQGIYDRYATVNVASLNSLYMSEWEALKKSDPEAAITFSLPGVGPPKLFESLAKRKGTGNTDE